jgi:SAM-dependent methyltransferase
MPEVARATDTTSDDQFVANLYRHLLQRQPSSHEVEHWIGILASGTPRADVVETFRASSEYVELQKQSERFRVSAPLPASASQQEQYVLSTLQARVAHMEQASRPVEPRSTKLVGRSEDSTLASLTRNLQRAQESVGQLNPRHPGLLNKFVQAGKKTVQRSLNWYTRSLQNFNSQVVTSIQAESDAILSVEQQCRELRDEVRRLDGEIYKLHAERLQPAIRAAELATQEHLLPYVEFFRGLGPVVDLGCGRGEFLALLKESGVTAYGVDSDPDACRVASAKSLRAFNEDVIDHLTCLPERSMGGIFSARLIEFLPLHLQMKLISSAAAKLKPGGVLLLETTNPESQVGHGRVARLDATNFRAIAPELMKSSLESNSFRDVKVLVQAAVEVGSHADAQPAGSKRLLSGPSYAVVGWRS